MTKVMWLNPGDKFKMENGRGQLRMFVVSSKLEDGSAYVYQAAGRYYFMHLIPGDLEVVKK